MLVHSNQSLKSHLTDFRNGPLIVYHEKQKAVWGFQIFALAVTIKKQPIYVNIFIYLNYLYKLEVPEIESLLTKKSVPV